MRFAPTATDFRTLPAGRVAAAFGLAILVFAFSAEARVARADATPIVLNPPASLDVMSPDGQTKVRYHAQAARQGRIDLTATNGFFDRTFEALDQQPMIPGDEGLIGCSFGCLGRLSDKIPGTARWHLWCPEAGRIKVTFFMQVPAAEAEHSWTITLGEETHSLKVRAGDGQSPQPQSLAFDVKKPGKVTLAIDCTKDLPPAETRIRFIRLEGSAVDKARLLRARWRPAAVHAGFSAPAACPAPRMWVFETRNVGRTSSYSPLTTPFGYFGTGFHADGRIPPGAGFNFSMWIAGRGATRAPPLEKMSRLIGTDIPEAQFSTFGGEGTGVKFRDAAAYKKGAERAIQALRIETSDSLVTFYGYFYDERAQRWRLFASAQSPGNRKNRSGLLARTGSFCEIPGPPNRERSGDLVREIKRRGWFYGSDEKWYRAALGRDAGEAGEAAGERASQRRSYYRADYAAEGWMGMAAGGMEAYFATPSGHAQRAPQAGPAASLPDYLSPAKTAQLFDLPVCFGPAKAREVAADHAAIDYEIRKTGPNSKAVLYYGTVDCLTFPPRTVTKGSPAEIDMARPERTWQSATPEQPVATGTNRFQLSRLKPHTTYYYRLYVAHDEGKSWDYQSGEFKTP